MYYNGVCIARVRRPSCSVGRRFPTRRAVWNATIVPCRCFRCESRRLGQVVRAREPKGHGRGCRCPAGEEKICGACLCSSGIILCASSIALLFYEIKYFIANEPYSVDVLFTLVRRVYFNGSGYNNNIVYFTRARARDKSKEIAGNSIRARD